MKDLTGLLDDLLESAPPPKPRPKPRNWQEAEVITHWQLITCRCTRTYESPRFNGSSIFLRSVEYLGKRTTGREQLIPIPHPGAYAHLDHRVELHHTTCMSCPSCIPEQRMKAHARSGARCWRPR